MKRAPKRRTQRERREETIAKLVDATIESLLAVGYGGTTVNEVCRRSGVSHGGLFRHFGSVLELVIAASEAVGRRQIAEFEARFARSSRRSDRPLGAALRLLRETCRSPTNAVFYELLVAARTHDELRKALEPAARRYYEAIQATAERLPGVEDFPPGLFEPLLFGIVHLFDGESLIRTALPRPEQEDRRLELLAELIELLRHASFDFARDKRRGKSKEA